jgi:hypothetical protein
MADTWLATLITDTPQAGFELAIALRAPLKIHFFEVKIRFIEFCSINA